MKILYFTDTHIRGSNPKSRMDNFLEALKTKFQELLSIAEEEKIDFVLFGGDLFDRPDISPSVIKEFLGILMKFPSPIYAISGNHDVYGQNPTTIGRTILGLLDTIGIVKLINLKERIYLQKDGVRVQLTGCPYYYDVDVSREGYIVEKLDSDYSINIVHGFLLEKPFIEGIPYTLIDDIADKTEADITICGHYHTGFGIKEYNNKYFVNPGAIARINNISSEIERTPSCLLIDLEKGIKLDIRKLQSAKPGEEVLDRSLLRQEEFRKQKLNEFVHQVNTYGSFEMINLSKIINEIALKDNIPSDVKDEAIRRISEAQIALSGEEVTE